MRDAPRAYACAEQCAGRLHCGQWCGDSSRCLASPMLIDARIGIEARYNREGAAAAAGTPNPYRPRSAAATWWQRGYDRTHAVVEEEQKS